jgi:predicted lipoprotein with Yx(FWY)xxD motif
MNMQRSGARRAGISAGLICVGLLAAGCASSSPSTPAASGAAVATVAAGTGSSSSPAVAGMTQIKIKKTALGKVLVNAQGYTLYWFAADTATSSACSGACASAWPPVIGQPTAAPGVSLPGTLGTIKRSDGSLQATYDGHPLYTFAGDSAPGKVTGNGIDGSGALWWAMTPSGAKLKHHAKAKAATPAKSTGSSGSGGSGGGGGGW